MSPSSVLPLREEEKYISPLEGLTTQMSVKLRLRRIRGVTLMSIKLRQSGVITINGL